MERVLVLVSLLMIASASAQNNLTTLDDFFLERYRLSIQSWSVREFTRYSNNWSKKWNYLYGRTNLDDTWLPLEKDVLDEIFGYLMFLRNYTALQFSRDLGGVSAQSLYDDLNGHCPETPVHDLRRPLNNATCLTTRLVEWLTSGFKEALDVGLRESCSLNQLSICSAESRSCSLVYESRARQLFRGYAQDAFAVTRKTGKTPLNVIAQYVTDSIDLLSAPFTTASEFLLATSNLISSAESLEPFSFENILLTASNKASSSRWIKKGNNTRSRDVFAWGIVKSNTGIVDFPCSDYRDIYSRNSKDFFDYFIRCTLLSMTKSITELISCVYKNSTSKPLALSSVPFFYVHSQCLCLASNGKDCGVNAPEGVEPSFYCLSVLFRDFQRQVWIRPAVTYLDYALYTRIPACKFSNYLQVAFKSDCIKYEIKPSLQVLLSVQCYFQGLVNKDLNCTERLTIHTYNQSELCAVKTFNFFVLCDDDADDEHDVSYYGTGDSTLLLFLTYFDVTVRVLTVVTYVSCPQLRNLPGKLLIAYMMTALVRLVVVRATLQDLPLAVRLDVSLDLASTLWLTAYLHFLTVSIMDLRPPDSLSPDEARVVLIRCSLLGWALPAALSTAFFFTDDVLDGRVQVGQLLFVLSNYAALFGNLYMCFRNCKFYYEVKSGARKLKHVKGRSVFAAIFNFAVKTSVLSGAGIIFRLLFTQIQGLVDVLDYYHALGTLHGLLLFLLYGCNREARAFWTSVYHSTLHRCHRRRHQNISVPLNSLEFVEIRLQNVAGPRAQDIPATTG